MDTNGCNANWSTVGELEFIPDSDEQDTKSERTANTKANSDTAEQRYPNSPKNSLKNTGTLKHFHGNEYIKFHSLCDATKHDSPYSGQFYIDGMVVTLHSEGSLIVCQNHYVARVAVKQLNEVDNAVNFQDANSKLWTHIKVEKVLLDQTREELQDAGNCLQARLDEMCSGTLTDYQSAENIFQLWITVKKKNEKHLPSKKMLKVIMENKFISQDMKNEIERYDKITSDAKLITWIKDKIISFLLPEKKINDFLKTAITKGIDSHRTELLKKSSSNMNEFISGLTDCLVLFVSANDMKLFCDMESIFQKYDYELVLSRLASKFVEKIKTIDAVCLRDSVPLTSQVYLFLCKSLFEVENELKNSTTFEKFLSYGMNAWNLTELPSLSRQSPLEICLYRQLKMLVNLANHFEPGTFSINKRFHYKFALFEEDVLQQMANKTHKVFGIEKSYQVNVAKLPDELQVWICLLDNAIVDMFPHQPLIKTILESLVKLYVNYILSKDFNTHALESLRVITHNIIRFLARIGEFIKPQNHLDIEILQKQIEFMDLASVENRMAFAEYRDVIEVFTVYWKLRGDIISNLTENLPEGSGALELQNLLLQCMCKALDKKVKACELIDFCRAFEEFLVDLNEINFEWYVRLPNNNEFNIFYERKVIEVVDNKWKDSARKCYKIVNLKTFEHLWQGLFENEEQPTHYLVNIMKIFLKLIISLTEKKKWNGTESLTEDIQINAMVQLAGSMRTSLLYLNEQADYIDFDRFLEENTKPFTTVVNESESFKDFSKRVSLIKESFWYIRNLNAIDIDDALNLCLAINDDNSFGREYLKSGFERYSEQFEEYMKAVAGLSTDAKNEHIAREILDEIEPQLVSEWTIEFKQQRLPIILAGLGAVWAIQNSKDVACTGKYLKPHSIQILCVLRLLGADNESDGVEKHLAQVLTGQGKSLVLGMIASVLALYSHDVLIMCYSDYLAERDANDFEELYKQFGISNKISYKTFDEMAREQLSEINEKSKEYINTRMGFSYKPRRIEKVNQHRGSVLLIDEVDVFFTDTFYGNTYNLANFLPINGLGIIQTKIWELVTQNNTKIHIKKEIEEYRNNADNPDIKELTKFVSSRRQYAILELNNDELCQKDVTNNVVYSEHIDSMIYTAIDVYNNAEINKKMRISSEGLIQAIDKLGKYGYTYYGYYNIFNYFRLKIKDFQQQIGYTKNYGFLILDIGSVSFAKLPENFPMILGVTGTLTSLNNYERRAVSEHYKISKSTITPSFFGCSNLKFDPATDCKCFQSTSDWIKHIFARISAVINDTRSVLVFFDADHQINEFKKEFASQVDRLNVLTVNTEADDKIRCIDDAGVAKTVTLASREMGRGVDFKSGASVEKNGGIHVIQTFFSLDVKEETQIKGRTARKDNRGSYELILCISDLEKLELVQKNETSSSVGYDRLNKTREKLTNKADELKDKNLQNAEKKHCKTIDFYNKL